MFQLDKKYLKTKFICSSLHSHNQGDDHGISIDYYSFCTVLVVSPIAYI